MKAQIFEFCGCDVHKKMIEVAWLDITGKVFLKKEVRIREMNTKKVEKEEDKREKICVIHAEVVLFSSPSCWSISCLILK